MLEFRLLGPLEVRDGERTIPVPRRKQRALLAALLLQVGRVVPKDRLVDQLWGEQAPRRAGHALENYVSQLRKLLGDGVILTRPPGYVIEVEGDQVDALRFERLVADARAASGEERAATLRDALSLHRGPPLADLAYEPFAQAEIPRLEELELAAREELIEAELELGRHAEAVPEVERLIAAHPYRERLRGQLMLALYRSGRQADALTAYQHARGALVEQLGIEPGEELQALERSILRQDPALRAPVREQTAGPSPPQPAPPSTARRPARKTVTVLFAHLAGPDELDPEALQALLDGYHEVARNIAERHGGGIERSVGQAVMAVFGVPAAREDDALRAVRAAVELHEALGELAALVGVATGEVLVSGAPGEQVVTGGPISLAEALARAASPGEILLSEQTHRLVRDTTAADRTSGTYGEPAYRLVELLPDVSGRGLRLDSPMVGRARQLAALRDGLAAAVADRTCQLFTVLGVAGVGKSRLVGEFLGGLGDGATILQGRCLSYGEAITFWPLIEAVRGSTELDDAEDAPTAGAMDSLVFSHEDTVTIGMRSAEVMRLIGDDAPAEETFHAARFFFESLALRRPLVVLFDDLHWAEPAFLDLVEHVAERSRDASILIVCGARPELLDERPAWGGGKVNSRSILLEPLTNEESEQLIDNLLGGSDLPRAVRGYIVGTAEGNPLFVEELLGSLVDQAVLRRDGETWTTVELPALVIPPSIQALLSARIDRLPDGQRVVLELASIEGKRFHRETVADLAPEELRSEIDARLTALAQRDLIRPRSGREHSFSFRHQLLRDAAYESIPKQARAELHERFAAWLERKAGDRVAEIEEILGYHLEQAYELRAQLAPPDERSRAIAARAAARLESAGRRAASRGDERAAARLLRRSEALLASRGITDEPV